MEYKKFQEQGFIEEFRIDLGIKLKKIQEKIKLLEKEINCRS